MLAHEHTYGFVSALSRKVQVSRQSLSTWKAQARAALEQTFADTASTTVVTPDLACQIVTLLVEGHSSYANIQVCLRRVTGQSVSIGTIAAVVQEAQARAMHWMGDPRADQHARPGPGRNLCQPAAGDLPEGGR